MRKQGRSRITWPRNLELEIKKKRLTIRGDRQRKQTKIEINEESFLVAYGPDRKGRGG